MASGNDYINQKIRALKRKLEMVEMKGGCCNRCGYNKNLSALEFHHIDEESKSFNLDARRISNSKLEKLKKELDKCELLCSNCHREHHNKDLELENIEERLDLLNSTKKSFNNPKPLQGICEVCNKRMRVVKGKRFCSDKCRYSHHPDIEIIEKWYGELGSWDKVAEKLNTTRRIIYGVRKRSGRI